MNSRVVAVATFDIRVQRGKWPFAEQNEHAIAQHWQRRKAENPSFFNGTVHLLGDHELSDTHFTGSLVPVSFASFLFWKDSGYPDKTVYDCFGSALVRSQSGSVILGRQSPGNINAGLTYLPGGFIDERDVGGDGRVDLAASVAREMKEELGFDAASFAQTRGARITFCEQLVSLAIEFVSQETSQHLVTQGMHHIAGEADSELEQLVAVDRLTDLGGYDVPSYARVLLEHLLPA